MNADKRLVLVLGMHRSGTSTLTKGLQALGVDLGSDFNPATPDNPTGFWEDKNFHALNEEMLQHLHRSWDDLQLVESETVLSGLEGFCTRARTLLDDFLRDKSLAGLKDPRFSLLLPFWNKVFAEAGVRVLFIIGFRNPLSVAESLSRRDDFPKVKSLWLWTLHQVFIVAGTTNFPHLVVDYDQMLENPQSQFDRLARFLSLPPNSRSLEIFCSEFLQPDLRHARHSTTDLQDDPDCHPIVLEIHQHFVRREFGYRPRRFDFLGASRFPLGTFPSSFQRTSAFKLCSGPGKKRPESTNDSSRTGISRAVPKSVSRPFRCCSKQCGAYPEERLA